MLYLSKVWGMWGQLLCWPAGRWESWLYTCLPALVVVFPFWWWETFMPRIWTGILGWSQQGAGPQVQLGQWKSLLIYRLDTPTTVPYNSSTTPGVLDIVLTKNLVTAVYVTTCSALGWDHLFDQHTVLIILSLPDCPDFRETGPNSRSVWRMAFVQHKPAEWGGINTCVEKLSSAILKVSAESTPKSHMHDDPHPPIPSHIQDEICLNNLLRKQWKITRGPTESSGQPPAEVNDQPAERMEKWQVELLVGKPWSGGQSHWKLSRWFMRVATPSTSLITPGGTALSDSARKTLDASVEARCQWWTTSWNCQSLSWLMRQCEHTPLLLQASLI